MKKISLEMLRLSSDEVLERSQMKKVVGSGSGYYVQCDNWTNWRPVAVSQCGEGTIICSGGFQCNYAQP